MFIFFQTDGYLSDGYNQPANFTIPIIALIAGVNFMAQGLVLLRTKSETGVKTGPWLTLGAVQTPLIIIGAALG
jgi:hypothetical protein